MKPLAGKVAVVAGATRGAGRGIATMLGEAGATVYCTGRNSRHNRTHPNHAQFSVLGRPETIEETAEMVTQYGGHGIPYRADHTDEVQVKALFENIESEQGRLDIIVNDIWGGDELIAWDKPLWESPISDMIKLFERALFTHIITAHYGLPYLIKNKGGLLVEVTDGDNYDYRGQVIYDLVKTSIIRLAHNIAQDIKPYDCTALAITPGFLRSEVMLEHFGVTEDNWRDGAKKDPNFIASESPFYVGRAVAALASDPNIHQKTGGIFSSWELMEEYGFTDMDGTQPNWGKYYNEIKSQ